MTMKWTSDKSLFLSRVLTLALLVLAAAALFCIPIITEWYDAVSGQDPIRTVLNICLYLSDIIGIFAVWQMKKLLGNVAKQAIFVAENVTCIRLISWCCLAVALIWLILSYWRLLAFFVAFIAAFAGLVLRVMKNLFAMAVALREENDFTI